MKRAKLTALLFIILMFAAATAYPGVEEGKSLFNDKKLGTNGKSCNTCHSGGSDIDGSKEKFTILGSQQNSIEDAVNFCIKMAMSGKPLGENSSRMKDLVSYLRTLKGGSSYESETPGY